MPINWKKIGWIIFAIIFIFAAGGGTGFYCCYRFIVGPSIQRIGQLRSELERARGINQQLEDSIRLRQETLDRAKSIIVGSQSAIARLRAVLELLQKAEQSAEMGGWRDIRGGPD